MNNIKPLGVNILVQPIKPEEVTKSGIVLPESSNKETPQEGKVLAVGESKSINPEISVGQKIIFKQYAGNKITIDDEEYIIMNAMEDVLAVIK